MTPMTPDVPAICASLTKAQREAMASDGSVIPSMGPSGFDTVVLGFQYGRSAEALHRRGLIQFAWAPCLLTELGMSVRAHLLKEQQP